jgi:hypothetical protein
MTMLMILGTKKLDGALLNSSIQFQISMEESFHSIWIENKRTLTIDKNFNILTSLISSKKSSPAAIISQKLSWC